MYKILFKNKINLLFLLISFLCLINVVGADNISFKSTEWLYIGESSQHQLGWHFFKNDVWRFPLGSNPNYGNGFSNSIVFSDAIPILALFFKSFKSFIPENFQYFSFWYFICFFLQLFFSFKIIKKFTGSDLYSVIGSFFFLISPIFIYRVDEHVALASQWILLFALYLGLTQKTDKTKLPWIFLIILSSLINLYFTAMVAAVYSLLRIFNLQFERNFFLKLIKDFFIIATLLILTLYIVGYFEIRVADSLSAAFGKYKLNLLSFFDPVNSMFNISWSWFLPDIKLSRSEEIEGFNYFGLGQIAMFLFVPTLFFNKKNKTNLFSIKNNREIKSFVLISLIFTLWALSNKISFGSYTLIEIPLNKYILGVFSLFATTGRMFWIVNYFLLILSIIIIYKCFKKKTSLLIIALFLIIQAADTSAGLKDKIKSFKPSKRAIFLKDQIWDDLFAKYKIVKTTYPVGWSRLLSSFAYSMEHYNIEKTNIVNFARSNRKASSETRYYLYDNFRKAHLALDTVYIVDGLGHLRHLKHIFKNENVGFFHRDNVWSMVMNEKKLMNDNDKNEFKLIKPKLLVVNEKKNLNFEDKDNYYGFGWSHNLGKAGIWSEGPISTLLFRTEEDYGTLKLEISCRPYITKKNAISEFDIYVNNTFNQNMKLTNKNQDKKIEIIINEKLIENNEIKIDFNFKNLVSPYEVLESPDSRKLGILMKNIKINPV